MISGTGTTINYIIECIALWWKQLSYTTWMYFALFLPTAALIYQLSPKRIRKLVLLASGWFFFFSLSGLLLTANIAASVFIWATGRGLDSINADKSLKRKERQKKKKAVLILAIILLLFTLICFKYLDFIGLNIVRISQAANLRFDWHVLNLAVPIGISYYTLEAIAYLTDVHSGKIEAEKSLINVFLFMSFFPKLLEGPITRYSEAKDLFSGKGIESKDLREGYQRILWGLFKKLVIADHLSPAVSQLFSGEYMDGGVALFAALLFTLQEYMDFSGSIDIAIGSARIFGIRLSENFRQPFFAKNASDFWRRWHITLGTFFKDYIFYPIAVSKPVLKLSVKAKKFLGNYASRFVAPTAALFFVWLSNGLWHGPRWTFIFYGMYYFVLIFIENIAEEPFLKLLGFLHLKETSAPVRIFRYVKLFIIVIIGEMFFRADSLTQGMEMFKLIFTDLRFDMVIRHIQDIGIDRYGYFAIFVGLAVVAAVETLKEAGISIRAKLDSLPIALRFAFWYACIFFVIIFGAYGTGYDATDLLYAQF
ncbi:MAG: MBOAT family protein [Lachnospiraceae bacterium]|nr:MBOAT family protein [Lachnospiraceae bacterium]